MRRALLRLEEEAAAALAKSRPSLGGGTWCGNALFIEPSGEKAANHLGAHPR